MRYISFKHLQCGVALLTALLVVALATAAGVAIATRQHIDIRRSENLFTTDQALLYARGGEAWAMAILARDRKDNEIDHLGEDWAKKIPPLPVDGGSVSGYIEDMQGRFNLNNLAVAGDNFMIDLDRLRRILASVELEPGLAGAIADWVDSDIEPRFPDGAEDDSYLGGDQAYRAANRPMVSISELRLVSGFTAEAVEKLAPYVCALPVTTAINVNTAPDVVLQSILTDLSESEVQQLVEAREQEAFASVDDFLRHPVFEGKSVGTQRLAVSSEFFTVTSEAQIGNGRLELSSLVQRTDASNLAVLARSYGGL